MNAPLPDTNQSKLKQFLDLGTDHGCPRDQLANFINAGLILQARQLAACAAARLCDNPDGPSSIGYGGARGGGKTHWLLAQLGADDCQRAPGIKCLLLRKVGKSNLEHFDSLRRRIYVHLPHEFNASRGLLTFTNGSRIYLGHYQCEKDIDSYLGLEYDVVAVEEATQLTPRKYEDISTCCRTSRPGWRPRIYSTTNPGGVGHQWYYDKFIAPHQCHTETTTRFIAARVEDNSFINPEYKQSLTNRTGWQYDAWYLGRWDFSAGQFFRNFHPAVHVVDNPPAPVSPPPPLAGPRIAPAPAQPRPTYACEAYAVRWIAAMDCGYTHRTVVLLAYRDDQNRLFVIDEHAERGWIPQRHAAAIKAMFARHCIYTSPDHLKESLRAEFPAYSTEAERLWHARQRRILQYFFAGPDVFSTESGGSSIADGYNALGLRLRPAESARIPGWSALLDHLGEPAVGIPPKLFIHKRCKHLIECLSAMQHDPERPGDILKSNITDDGTGGDDEADALRYLVATKIHETRIVPLRF